MLPPLRIEASSAVSAKAQAAAAAPKGAAAPSAAARPELAEAVTHISSAEPGQLNILSFGSSDPFPAALRTLASQLGEALGLRRNEGETDAAYAQRLAAAIRNLPASSRAGVEKLIGQALQSIQLQTLLDVLDSPTGVQAARIAALIEGGRERNGEAAARNVLESYHQNEADDLGNDLLPTVRRPAVRNDAPARGAAAGQVSVSQASPAANGEKPVQASMVPSRQAEPPASSTVEKPASSAQPAAGPANTGKPDEADVHQLRRRLENAYTADTRPPVEQKRADALLQPPVANRNVTRGENAESHQTLQVLKGWTEVMTEKLLANAVKDPDGAAKVSVLAKALVEAEQPKAHAPASVRPSVASTVAGGIDATEPAWIEAMADGDETPMRGTSNPSAASASRNAAAEQETAARESASRANAGSVRQALLQEGSQMLAAQAALAQSKEGIPFTQVGYLTAQDDLQEERKRRRFNWSEGDSQGQAGEERAADQQESEDEAEDDGEHRTPRMVSDDEAGSVSETVEDPMYDLYRRMAGWN